MLDLALVLCVAFIFYAATAMRSHGLLNANALFVYIQMIMALGTFASLEPSLPSDQLYGYVVFIAMLGYFLGSGMALVGKPQAARGLSNGVVLRPVPSMWALVALSCVIVVVYFWAVGYSALFDGIKNSLTGGDADIAGQRLESYSGTNYLFPGYVNQFKNAFLPALVLVILTYWHRVGLRHYVLGCLLLLITLFGLLGTGQRGAFVQATVAATYFLYLMGGRKLPRRSWLLVPSGLAVIIVSTIALGRSNATLGQDASLSDRTVVAFREFGSRIFEVQQESAVAGFRYIYNLPIQWGREWMQGLLGILPGSPGTSLPNQIYASLYGTDRGTAPPSVWGSIYHNFGWFGVLIIPVLLGLVVGIVTLRSSDGVSRNSLELVGIAGVSTSIGFWAAGGPESLLNTGLVAYAVLWVWGSHHRAKVEVAGLPEPLPPRRASSLRGGGAAPQTVHSLDGKRAHT